MSAKRQELLTLTAAAKRCGVSRSALRRALDADAFPGAVQSDDDRGTWQIPVADLIAAGYLDSGEQVANSPRTGHDLTAEQVAGTGEQVADSPEQVTPAGVGLVRWEDVQGLVGQLVTAQDDRARAETELRVATFQLEQAQAETERLRAELEQVRQAAPTGRRWGRPRG